MKATGIIRRIDGLGRIVIPKEIRKTLRLKEGENLEIYTDNSDSIILKKYSLMNKLEDLSQIFTDSIYSLLRNNIIITNTDEIIAVAGKFKKTILNKNISKSLLENIKNRDTVLESNSNLLKITDELELNVSYALSTIFVGGDSVGLVLIFSENSKITELEMKIIELTSHFLAKHIEN